MRRLTLVLLALTLAACATVPPTVSDPAEPLPTQPSTTSTPAQPTVEPSPTEVPVVPLLTPPAVTPLPQTALIIYTKEGGLAFTSTTITVNADGSARMEGSALSIPIAWQVPADKFQALQTLLNDPTFAAMPYDPNTQTGCDDCYVLMATALTPQGVKSFKYDQADLMMTPGISPHYDELVVVMKAIEDSALQAGALPTEPTTGTTPKPGVGTLPNDVLLTYDREGGFAYSHISLVIHLDGRIDLSLNETPEPTQRALSAREIAVLQAALNNPSLTGPQTGFPGACNDCYIYIVTARTDKGIVTLRADDAELSTGKLALFQDLLGQLQVYANP
jgi:hypothetical protein